eukprot:GFKZ01012433.1.p1 GENE.GFKZ01012433.1~~GFKZ01012433.1.p1  ORF type:complete len:744 (+),score=89.44 GFKZ01012433.1:290-2521(+)
MSISVKVSYNSALHRFKLPRSDNFFTLCEAIVKALHLKISAKLLSNPGRTPLTLWFLDDEGDYCRLFDDFSLQEAVRLSPRLLRIRIRPGSDPPENIDVQNLPVIGSVPALGSVASVVPPQFSTSTLLKLLSYLRRNAPSDVEDALDTLQDTLKRRKPDLPCINDVRSDLASLFSNFLAKNLGPSSRGKVSRKASDALQDSLRELLSDVSVSRATREAAGQAVRAVCECRTSCDLLRVRYSALVSDLASKDGDNAGDGKSDKTGEDEDEKNVVRPVKYYLKQFVKLMRVAGPDTQDAYETFAVLKREAEERGSKFKLPRCLCKGIQRAGFHFLRCHVKEGREFEIETRAVKSLGKAVLRKLQRQGYDQNVAEAAKDLAEVMAMDRQVLKLAFQWANNPDKPVTEPVDDEDDLPEFKQEDEGWGDWNNAISESSRRKPNKKKKKKPQQGRYQWGSSRHDRWSDQSNSSSSESRSDRRSKRQSLHDRLNRRRRKRGGRRSGSSTSSSSVQSMQEAEWDDDRRWNRKGGSFADMISPMDSFQDPWRREGSKKYNSDGHDTTGTHESQWARVEMDKDREMLAKRARQTHLALKRQMERERRMEIQLARNQEIDMEAVRRPDIWHRGSRRPNYGFPQGEFSSHQQLSGSRRGSHHIRSPHHGSSGWRHGHGQEAASQTHWGAGGGMGEHIPLRSSRRTSFRPAGDRARDSFLGRDEFPDLNDQRRGSMPPVWDGNMNQPVADGQDWGP